MSYATTKYILTDASNICPPAEGKAVVYVLSTKYKFCPVGIAANIEAKSVLLPDDIVIEVVFAVIVSPVVKVAGEVTAWNKAPAAF